MKKKMKWSVNSFFGSIFGNDFTIVVVLLMTLPAIKQEQVIFVAVIFPVFFIFAVMPSPPLIMVVVNNAGLSARTKVDDGTRIRITVSITSILFMRSTNFI